MSDQSEKIPIEKDPNAVVHVKGWNLMEVPNDVRDLVEQLEHDFQSELENRGRGEGGWASRYHCAALSYLQRPMLYHGGHESWLFQAVLQRDGEELPAGTYVVSKKMCYLEGRKGYNCFGYLARVNPVTRSHGIGSYLFLKLYDYFALSGTFGSGVVARDNFASLKMSLKAGAVIGTRFIGEQITYLLNARGFPHIAVPGALFDCLTTPAAIDEAFQRVWGDDGFRLADPQDILGQPQHAGHFRLRQGDAAAAGISLWRPDYSTLITPAGERSAFTLFYNPWTLGEAGELLLLALLSRLLREEPQPLAMMILTRHVPSTTVQRPCPVAGISTFQSHPVEKLVRPHALGYEEEQILAGYLTYLSAGDSIKTPVRPLFYDPRDLSTLICFHPIESLPHDF